MAPPAKALANDPFAHRRVEPGVVVKISATLAIRHLDAFRAEVGAETVRQAIATLPRPLQIEIDALVSGAWLSVDDLDQVYEAIAQQAGRPLSELLPAAVLRGNEAAFNSIWKVLLRMAPGRLLLRRSTAVFQKTYSHGVMQAVDTGKEVYLELTHWPGASENRLLGTAAGIRAAMRVAGYLTVKVDYTRTEDGARFTVEF